MPLPVTIGAESPPSRSWPRKGKGMLHAKLSTVQASIVHDKNLEL